MPGFLEADFNPAKKLVGFVAIWVVLIFVLDASVPGGFTDGFVSPLVTRCRLSVTLAGFEAVTCDEPLIFTSVLGLDSPGRSGLPSLTAAEAFCTIAPLVCGFWLDFSDVSLYDELLAALSKIFCAKDFPRSSPRLTSLGRTLSNLVFSNID